MHYLDLGIYYLFTKYIFGYFIIGYLVYQPSKKIFINSPKVPVVLVIVSVILSFWYLPSIPMKHWGDFVNEVIELDKEYGKVVNQVNKVIITIPREIADFGGKDRHLLEESKIIYPSKSPQENRLLEVDCNEKTIEESIPTDEILHTGKTYKKVNIFNEEILNGEYLFLLDNNGFPIQRKMNDYEFEEFCEYDWSSKKEKIKSEFLKQSKSELKKEKNK